MKRQASARITPPLYSDGFSSDLTLANTGALSWFGTASLLSALL